MPQWWVFGVLEAGGPPLLIAWIIWVVVSITLHELAHGWTAIRRGDSTPIDTGHMTWNPVVHMGPQSLLAFAVLGIAWGMMPVDPSRMRGRYADAAVAAAGPIMNLSIAAICIVGSAICQQIQPTDMKKLFEPSTIVEQLMMFFAIGCWLNIALGLFNLLPAPPLDGSRILANFSFQYRDLAQTAGGQFGGMVTLIIGFVFMRWLVWVLAPTVWVTGILGLLWLFQSAGLPQPPNP